MRRVWYDWNGYGLLLLLWPGLPAVLPLPELELAGAWELDTGAAAAGAE